MALRKSSVLLLTLCSLAFTACNKSSDGPPPPNPKAMMKSDREMLAKMDADSPRHFDLQNDHVYSKVFGGTSGVHVLNYVDERLNYYFTESELDTFRFTEAPDRYTGWQATDPRDKEDTEATEKKMQVGASNVSAGLFAMGAIQGRPITIENAEGVRITFESPRAGVMLAGPGYTAPIEKEDGTAIPLPVEVRQLIIVHEARHSDCSVPTNVRDFQVARSATSKRDFLERFKKIECGHLHTLCPRGHKFAGASACDRQPWGAYAIGAIYLMGHQADAKDETERRIFRAVIADMSSRVLVDFDDMMDGKLGQPDMAEARITW